LAAAPLSASVKTGNNENVINTKLLSSLPLVHTKLFMVRTNKFRYIAASRYQAYLLLIRRLVFATFQLL
jgi:hypothetical protein